VDDGRGRGWWTASSAEDLLVGRLVGEVRARSVLAVVVGKLAKKQCWSVGERGEGEGRWFI